MSTDSARVLEFDRHLKRGDIFAARRQGEVDGIVSKPAERTQMVGVIRPFDGDAQHSMKTFDRLLERHSLDVPVDLQRGRRFVRVGTDQGPMLTNEVRFQQHFDRYASSTTAKRRIFFWQVTDRPR